MLLNTNGRSIMYVTRQKVKFLVVFVVLLGFANVFTIFLAHPVGNNEKRHAKTGDGTGSEASVRTGKNAYRTEQPASDVPKNRLQNTNNETSGLHAVPPVEIPCDDDTEVIVLLTSMSSNGKLRDAIRETWAKVAGNGRHRMRTLFVTGKANATDNLRENTQFQEEAKEHRDILMGDFVFDLKIKTTLPLMLGVKWILGYCESVRYIAVGYDTMVVNEKKLLDRLEYCDKHGISNDRTWIGKISIYTRVQRERTSIFYVSPNQYNTEYFPPFCTDENGYVFTRAVAKEFLESAESRTVVPIADVFLGIIGQERNWTLVDDELFTRSVIQEKNVCAGQNSVTMRAPNTPEELIKAWKNINNMTMLRDCVDPDLDLVLPTGVDNRGYLDKVLSYRFYHPHICYNNVGKPLDIFMIVLISTPPDHGEVRNAIRETWCKDTVIQGKILRCVFIMGQLATETDEVNARLREEDVKYGDIIQGSFSESFQNLTLKVILGLKWITENCRHTKYFYKGDEDMFVNFNNIISYIKQLRSRGEAMTKFFIGSRMYSSIRYSPNIKEHKGLKRYHVPDNMYFGHYYPPYCSGGGYILSAETVPLLYHESMRTSLINVDDAFQGILTKRLGYGPVGHSGFKNWGGKTDTCSLRDRNTMTVHGIGKNAHNLHEVWNTYQNTSVNCTGFI